MTYESALEYIHKKLIFGSKPGLSRIENFLDILGNPQDKLKFIHVAGTNGKGSACTYISSILKESGLKVGLYTSPYVLDFRERMQINGEMISKSELVDLVEQTQAHEKEYESENEAITEFEYITALAFLWFLKNNCDIVVLEVGLGGRFDATNVISKKELAVLMSISLDHTQILGESIEEIAKEKCGIIKNVKKVVTYPLQEEKALDIIKEQCKLNGATLLVPAYKDITINSQEMLGTNALIENIKLRVPLSGLHQVYNAQTAICAVKAFDDGIKECHIISGIEKAFIPARMEFLRQNPPIILDGSHNDGGAKILEDFIKKHKKQNKITAIMGMMKDKDSLSFLKKVAPYFDKIIAVTPNNPRALDKDELLELAKKFTTAVSSSDMQNACNMALNDDSDIIFICGSLYLAGEIRQIMLDLLKN